MSTKIKKMLALRYAALTNKDKLLVRAELSHNELAVLDGLLVELKEINTLDAIDCESYRSVCALLDDSTLTEPCNWDGFVAEVEMSSEKIPRGLLNIISEVAGARKYESSYEF